MRARLVLLCLGLVMAASPAAAQPAVDQCARQCHPLDDDVNGPEPRTSGPVVVILYGHVMGFPDVVGFPSQAVLTTSFPAAAEPESEWSAPLGSSTSDQPVLTARLGASEVEYVDGAWRVHNEAGPVRQMNTSGQAVAYVYLSAGGPASAPDGGVAPQVVVESRLDRGLHAESAVIIAQGTSDPATLVTAPGDRQVYEMRVPMTWETARWEGEPGDVYTWRVWVRTLSGEVSAADANVRVHAGPRFLPRLLVEIEPGLRVESRSVSEFAGQWFPRVSVQSPFGSYDVDDNPTTWSARLDGPTPIPPDALRLVGVKRSVDRDANTEPLNVTWRINLTQAGAETGLYTFHVTPRNLQGTLAVPASVQFAYVAPPPDATPGVGAGLGLAALAGVAVWGRRRL